jgi:hypothetical protein
LHAVHWNIRVSFSRQQTSNGQGDLFMKQNRLKKLSLSRETVRQLDADLLAAAVGGMPVTALTNCNQRTCADTCGRTCACTPTLHTCPP